MRTTVLALMTILTTLPSSLYAGEVGFTGDATLLDEKFGPLPVYEQVITGVELDDLIRSLIGTSFYLKYRDARPNGVSHSYAADTEKYPALSASVGVYENQSVACRWFVREWKRTSGPLLPRLGLGDRALVGSSRALVLFNNVFVDFSVRDKDQKEMLDRCLESLLRDLKSGSPFVSRGKCVSMPVIQSVGLPDRVQHGHPATGKVALSNIDLSKALFGMPDPYISVKIGKGGDAEIEYIPPSQASEAGPKTFTLCVATPENVVATKEFTVVVE